MEIEGIDALQWTSGDAGPAGTLPDWDVIYDKAIAAGKSIWVKVYSGEFEDWIRNVDRIVKKLKLPQEKVPYNLEEFGNLGGASIPSLMVSRLRKQLLSIETTLLMSSFGLGLTWGTLWMKTKPMVMPDIIGI